MKEKLIYKTYKHTYDFRKFNTIRTFGKDIYNRKITLEEADENQSDLSDDKTRPKTFWQKELKEITLDN